MQGIFEQKVLAGSHHLHLDPNTRENVAAIIHNYLKEP